MGERIGMDIVNMIWDRCANAVEAPDYENCKMDVLQTLAMEVPFTEEEFRNEKKEKLADRTFDAAMELFKQIERMAQIAYPVISKYTKCRDTYVKHTYPHHRRKTYVQHLLQPEESSRDRM